MAIIIEKDFSQSQNLKKNKYNKDYINKLLIYYYYKQLKSS